MEILNSEHVDQVSAGSVNVAVNDFFRDVGYGVGYLGGYLYNNLIIGNGITDDLAYWYAK